VEELSLDHDLHEAISTTKATSGRNVIAVRPSTTHKLTKAEIKSNAKPAYAHSLILLGNFGTMRTIDPRTLNTVSKVTK
jgi:hypothetical protein